MQEYKHRKGKSLPYMGYTGMCLSSAQKSAGKKAKSLSIIIRGRSLARGAKPRVACAPSRLAVLPLACATRLELFCSIFCLLPHEFSIIRYCRPRGWCLSVSLAFFVFHFIRENARSIEAVSLDRA